MIVASKRISDYFLTKQAYVTAMGAVRPHPIVAPEGTTFPFATYTIDRVETLSKDAFEDSVSVYFWFAANKFTEMATLMEDLVQEVRNDFDFQAATMDFVEDNLSYVGIINFLIN